MHRGPASALLAVRFLATGRCHGRTSDLAKPKSDFTAARNAPSRHALCCEAREEDEVAGNPILLGAARTEIWGSVRDGPV